MEESFIDDSLNAQIITTENPIVSPLHQDIECNFVDGGSITYLLGSNLVAIESGRWALFWAAIPHHVLHVESEVHLYRLTIPLNWFLNRGLPDHIIEPVMKGDMIVDERGDMKLDIAMFKRWCSDLDLDSINRRDIVLLELEARIRRMAFYATVASPPPETIKIDKMADVDLYAKAKTMADYVMDYYTSPITVTQVAEAVDLIPRHAEKLFALYFQCSIDEYLMRYRVAQAQQLLVTTDLAISSVSTRSGFRSMSQFIAVFKSSCHHTPKAYRSLFSIL